MRAQILVPVVLLLSSCGGGEIEVDADGDGAISADEAEVARDEMIKPQPGQYRSTQRLVDLQFPDASAQEQELLKRLISTEPQVTEFCLTESDAENGFAPMFRQISTGTNCKVDSFVMDGGKFSGVMTCNERGTMSNVTVAGEGGRISSQATITVKGSAPDGSSMMMKTEMEQERVGDCDGSVTE